ncbi:MAG: hypothetical protein KatS3mg057_0906 [Herpetosiphonaceae bacterium]|nr:MAG: hypothetical protein KatS3mg057_0906 [Herpetosiphonaceae bacterium]
MFTALRRRFQRHPEVRPKGPFFITNATAPTGAAAVRALAASNVKIFAGVPDPASLLDVEPKGSSQVIPLIFNLAELEQLNALPSVLKEQLGDQGLAGIIHTPASPFDPVQIQPDDEQAIGKLVTDAFIIARLFLRLLIKDQGRFLFIHESFPLLNGWADTIATKLTSAAFIGSLSEGLQAQGVRFTAIEVCAPSAASKRVPSGTLTEVVLQALTMKRPPEQLFASSLPD